MPRFSLASVFRCGSEFRIATLTALTGSFVTTGPGYYTGISEAVKAANAQGCKVRLLVFDSPPWPDRLLRGALIAGERDRASIIIAPFGPAAKTVAERVSSALIVDLLQTSLGKYRPKNLISLPYSIFFTANPSKYKESLHTLGRVAARILLDTIRYYAPGSITSPSGLVDAMAGREYSSPKGALVLNPVTGVFELSG